MEKFKYIIKSIGGLSVLLVLPLLFTMIWVPVEYDSLLIKLVASLLILFLFCVLVDKATDEDDQED